MIIQLLLSELCGVLTARFQGLAATVAWGNFWSNVQDWVFCSDEIHISQQDTHRQAAGSLNDWHGQF